MLRASSRRSLSALAPIALFWVMTGCEDSGHPVDHGSTTGTLHLVFVHRAGNDNITKGTNTGPWPHTTAAGNEYNIYGLRYYISEVVLHGPDGDKTYDIVHYVDMDDPATLRLTLTDVPPLHFEGVRFTFGLDESKNLPVEQVTYPGSGSMAWPEPWGGGYHYMQIDGYFLDGGISTAFFTHTGRLTDGTGEHHHFFPAEIVAHFSSHAGHEQTVEVVMDINGWYDDPVIDLNDHRARIMENTPEQDRVQANGVNVFRVGAIIGDEGGHDHP